MAVDAKLVKELREITGSGFLDVKKALEATNNNMEEAIAWLQERGQAKAVKKGGAIAAEGVTVALNNGNKAIIFEVNSQTDFVAKNDKFKELVSKIGEALISSDFTTTEEANNNVMIDGKTIAETTLAATATIGEKIVLRRAACLIAGEGEIVASYTHFNNQFAGLFVAKGTDGEAARNVAMHIASMNPQYLDEASVPEDIKASLKAEIMKDPEIESKPEKIRPKIAEGKFRRALSGMTLVFQEFVMEKMPVQKYLDSKNLSATSMLRFQVGEGIEKKEEDFAAEVAAQMNK